ncbi:Chromatin modification-related protein EAF1 B [Camellia lanceoleosa]|uniref:Chromatin modification-related protein EAF1 B n=1 Tax=Camellia lanceoleosa TaxID=1840588 RepID=A0ACC0GMW2_9ERIC|nr:Chromatin modification-related protein EAF1 B [Camellia lanceoleosa]
MLPGQNPEHQRQMMVPELQMQVAQGNSQGVPPFVGLSSAFSNQTSPPAQTYPFHPQQAHVLSNSHHPYLQGPNHVASTQHQAYAIRIAKERQMRRSAATSAAICCIQCSDATCTISVSTAHVVFYAK